MTSRRMIASEGKEGKEKEKEEEGTTEEDRGQRMSNNKRDTNKERQSRMRDETGDNIQNSFWS